MCEKECVYMETHVCIWLCVIRVCLYGCVCVIRVCVSVVVCDTSASASPFLCLCFVLAHFTCLRSDAYVIDLLIYYYAFIYFH